MAQQPIPDQMNAVVLDDYTGVEALRVEQRPVPKPGRNEVLVKVAASPINPSDLAFLEGGYGFKKPAPVVPGFEGSGIVAAAGPGLMGRYLYGRRVACVSQARGDGTWAEFMVTPVNAALPLSKSVSLEQGAMAVVNPLTAIALLTIAKQGGHKTILHTAAAGALGQMLNRLARREGIQIIHIVRRQAQVALLKRQGAAIVLNSSDPDFDRRLRETCRQHGARLAFDAVAGSMTLRLLEAMPRGGRVTVYGGLSDEPAQATPGQLIFQSKAIDGFWLSTWLRKKNLLQILLIWRRAQKLLPAELGSEIRGNYPLQEVRTAVKAYQNEMTAGKLLLRPGQGPAGQA